MSRYNVGMTFTRTKVAVAAALLAAFSLFGVSVAHAAGTDPRVIHMSFPGGTPTDSNVKTLCNPSPVESYTYIVTLDNANRANGTYALKVKESVGGGLVRLGTFVAENQQITVGGIGPSACIDLVFRNAYNSNGVVLATAYDVDLGLYVVPE